VPKLEWSEIAIQRINEIADFIALDNPTAADNWVDEVFEKAELIRMNPKLGRKTPELDDDMRREIFHGNYRIAYRILNSKILISTVQNCAEIRSIND
jgi:plasmid stabilization system protein ParE